MDFSKSILSDKPYLGASVGGNGVPVSVEAVVVAEVREVKNNILERSRKLRLSKSIQRDP